MKSDITTKFLLSVIAIALIANLFKVTAPPAHAQVMAGPITALANGTIQVAVDAVHQVAFIASSNTGTVAVCGYTVDKQGHAKLCDVDNNCAPKTYLLMPGDWIESTSKTLFR
jgi:hypothetical protein